MAANYLASGSFRTVQVFGGIAVDVEVVQVTTLPSLVTFSYAVPLDLWTGNQAAGLLAPIAAGVENIIGYPEVAGARYEEDVDAAGNLVSLLVIIVQASSSDPLQPGPFTGEVRAKLDFIGNPAQDTQVNPLIDAEYARLQALIAA